MGVKDSKALAYAEVLGDAMQFTNFLRDIKEDVIYLDRIYLPLKDLQKYGLDHNDIIIFANDFENKDPQKWSAFKSYMQDQIRICRKMYLKAEK
jgi:phytoene/squalene synthetase